MFRPLVGGGGGDIVLQLESCTAMRYSMEEEGGGSRLMLVNYGTARVTRVPYRHGTGSNDELGKAGTYARSTGTGAGRPRGNCGR